MFTNKFEGMSPDNRAAERRQMVEKQIARRGIKNEAVLNSMLTVPRHLFVPFYLQDYAYFDRPLGIGEEQTISQPYIVALMTEILEPAPTDRVLEIGAGSGYAAAILSRIVSMVYTVERIAKLAKEAQSRFYALGYNNIRVHIGDGTKGWPEEAPFDKIIVSAGAPSVPKLLCSQLKPGGRLVIPAGDRDRQKLLMVQREPDGSFTEKDFGLVCFVPLIGKEGWDG